MGLLGKLLLQEIGDEFAVAVEQPADDAQRKHVAALENRLVVHARILEALFHHCGDGTVHHTVGVDAELSEVVVGCKLGFP